ncbi:hypothetical protein RYA05_06220 [Pseudomonas syringae pv. actinidiae]|uniref:exodeoxyribonuclease VII small subunit n=1 Tax=Pseudomonas viridiflava TaxID=33069 RepID=UPI0018E5F0D5|nr:exodeoxyribonuclease VII small subunit [Pseudomonas viridiflava]MBI6727060.1 hypothetical protein [Pseudomonas viridiflava]MDU8351481.1 hypothetical protein [Pseudomonas syringae pv. actinidiae]
MNQQTASYSENYTTLAETVRTLNSMAEPDVDKVLPIVERANSAYKLCIERITQVEAALGIGQDQQA